MKDYTKFMILYNTQHKQKKPLRQSTVAPTVRSSTIKSNSNEPQVSRSVNKTPARDVPKIRSSRKEPSGAPKLNIVS